MRALPEVPDTGLTPARRRRNDRDAAILRLTAEGLRPAEIASGLGCVEATVKNRLGAMRSRYGALTCAHMVALAYTSGDLPDSPTSALGEVVGLWRQVQADQQRGAPPVAALRELNAKLCELAGDRG